MKKLIIIALALSIGACAQVTKDFNAITGATVSPTAIIVAGNAFDAVEATATNYLRLTKCNGSNGPVCRNVTATKAIIPAIRAARIARNNLEAFLSSHPTALGAQGLYDALQAATTTLSSILTQYNIK